MKPVVAVGETFSLNYTVTGQGCGFQGPVHQRIRCAVRAEQFDHVEHPVHQRADLHDHHLHVHLPSAGRQGREFQHRPGHGHGRPENLHLELRIGQGREERLPREAHPSQPSKALRANQQQGQAQSGANDVYVKAFASNANPMMGEGIIVTYKIYTKVQIAQLNISKISSFQGFWSQNLLDDNDKLVQTRQVIDGEAYTIAEIRKVALFPLKSGKLVIEPLEMECAGSDPEADQDEDGRSLLR
ncbi:MAG: hypothetical protein MZV63_56315 [Marinilabiliales bacterium]|nr:hypothetical protein [Marinilabiliales bacterium]